MATCLRFLFYMGITGRKHMAVYGYVRVSSKDQNEDRQMIALREVGVPEKTYLLISSLGRISIVRSISGS